ncbi:hypothetical protein Sros01_38740 [Streptomyces roseochromogenus]|nr:hypothetical protein Sros01_38740 [Streptomyces roseochromogenus]
MGPHVLASGADIPMRSTCGRTGSGGRAADVNRAEAPPPYPNGDYRSGTTCTEELVSDLDDILGARR